MRKKFSSISVVRLSRRRSSKAKLTRQSSLNSTRVTAVSVQPLPATSKTITAAKQKTLDQQPASADLSFNRVHRVTPVNSHDLLNDDFIIAFDDRHRRKKKRRIVSKALLCKLGIGALLVLLIIGGLVGILVYALTQSKNSTATGTTMLPTTVTTTAATSVCSIGGLACSTPMLSWNQTGVCTASAPSYRYHSCCYQAVSNQVTIEFKLFEEVGRWFIDDVSMTQGNGELVTNGGFEANLTGWMVTSSANLSVTPLALVAPMSARSGQAYLYSTGIGVPDKIRQTVSVVQGQPVNVSFWWYDEGGAAGPTERCEGTVTLTP